LKTTVFIRLENMTIVAIAMYFTALDAEELLNLNLIADSQADGGTWGQARFWGW
jgi:hypothetical protein